jgi:hypothetical protein
MAVRLRKSQILKELERGLDQSRFRSGILTGELPDRSSRIIIMLEDYKIKRILFDDEEEGPGIVEGETLERFLSHFFLQEFVAGTRLRWTWEPRPNQRSEQ